MHATVAPAEPRLSARGIGKSFHGHPALIDVDLDLRGGEMLAVVGANGAGKSTLIKIICGALRSDRGEIRIDGRPVTIQSVGDAHAAGIAVAHQQIAIIPCLTAAENIMLGREPLRAGFIRNGPLYAEARRIASRFGIDIALDRECGELGLGENKILDILKALVSEPAILILDEPTASLTLNESRKLFAFLRDLKAQGLAIIFISHHLNEIFEQCDHVVVLKDGRKVHDGPVAQTTPEEIVHRMVGRAIEDTDWSSSKVHGKVTLRLEDTTIAGLRVPELTVHAGEVVGIAGVLGGGQTEVLETLAGDGPRPVGGDILVNGEPGCPRTVPDAIARGVYLVADERLKKALFPGLSVEENLLTGSLAEKSRFGFMQAGGIAAAAQEATRRLAIKCRSRGQDILQLSGGNQQKVAFGRWLIRMDNGSRKARPLLLLDNPTEGVDVGSKAELYGLIRDLARGGASILIASAEFPEMLKLCDRIYCVADKSIGTCLDRADFSEERLLLEVN
ncbi:sugar ABC transporter ATP-binding protein [Labrys monachus]|uniref:Ribose transport system ATP-binding protein n=1 Tax=Labrys monachus TaxID=217067 RepID=A0ABU0FML5_9HYPH|nr:sugar ABC transporter ATP-binding protein [Labrys monachus]MDQ0395328.1 ribose transport system ATP-binding protein [Labrys monachus]